MGGGKDWFVTNALGNRDFELVSIKLNRHLTGADVPRNSFIQGRFMGDVTLGCSRSDCFVKDFSGNFLVREKALYTKLFGDVTDEQAPAVDL